MGQVVRGVTATERVWPPARLADRASPFLALGPNRWQIRTNLSGYVSMPLRLAILTISDAGSRGERSDSSGDLIAAWARERGFTLAERGLIPDQAAQISATLSQWCDAGRADLILTTGGTGLTERDVTPEATRTVLEKEAPGIGEALRMSAFPRFPRAALSRGTAGVRGKTLIVNLPGSPGGVRDGLTLLGTFVDHAVELVSGTRSSH